MSTQKYRSAISFMIILVGILASASFLYVNMVETIKPIKYKDLSADYQFWFDGNSLESTGTIEANMIIVGSAEITSGYDYEGLHVLDPSSYAEVQDGGTYYSLSFAEFVYIDLEKNINRIAELGRYTTLRRNLFTFYLDSNRLCLRTYWYDALRGINQKYYECSEPITTGWHSIGIRWTSSGYVETYLDGNYLFTVPYNDTSFRMDYAAFFGDVIHDEIKIFFDYVDDVTLEQALLLYAYPLSRETYDLVSSLLQIIFITSILIIFGSMKAFHRQVEYYGRVYALSIIEIILLIVLMVLIIAARTGINPFTFVHFVEYGGFTDMIVQSVATLTLFVHLAVIYETTIRT